MKSSILFIINPVSGGKEKQNLPGLINSYLDLEKFKPVYCFTSHIGHAAVIAGEAVGSEHVIIVAAGGDGTINEVASRMLNSDKILGIIPLGSGNGLARSLKIPMSVKKAVQLINRFEVSRIDVGTLNGQYFFNMAGIGFDAQISAAFEGNKSRGLWGYLRIGAREVKAFRPELYMIEIDGYSFQRNAFMISIANSSQYGNDFHISPLSSLRDGLLEVCIVKPIRWYLLPLLGLSMLRSKTHRSKRVDIISGKHIKISRGSENPVHIDGEPFIMGKMIEVDIIPDALKVINGRKSDARS